MVTGKAYVPSGHQNTEVFRPEGNLPAKGHPWRGGGSAAASGGFACDAVQGHRQHMWLSTEWVLNVNLHLV